MAAGLPLALLASARADRAAERVEGALRSSPVACSLAGFAGGLAVVLLAAAARGIPALGLPLLLVATAMAAASFAGLVAEARRLGREVRGRAAGEGPAGGSVAAGWLVLSGLPLLPVAGTFVFLYLALRGGGAVLVALRARGEGGARAAATDPSLAE
jgi:hypothetical protein